MKLVLVLNTYRFIQTGYYKGQKSELFKPNVLQYMRHFILVVAMSFYSVSVNV